MRVSVRTRGSSGATAGAAWGCAAIVVAIGLTLGGMAFQYSLWSIFGKDVPWYADAIAGVIVEPIVIPLAVLCWIARLCGVEVPFFS